jgi:hypothetical protein
MESIVRGLILNLIYRQFLKSVLSGTASQGGSHDRSHVGITWFFSVGLFLAHAFDAYRVR